MGGNVTGAVAYPWWRELEASEVATSAAGAEHWVTVYDQLLAALTQLRRDYEEDDLGHVRVTRYVREAESRRRYWLSRIPTEHPSA